MKKMLFKNIRFRHFLLILLCLLLLLGISQIRLWRTLVYDCYISDEVIFEDLEKLNGYRVSIVCTYQNGQTTTVGYRGTVGSADAVLEDLSSAGGLIYRTYPAGKNFAERAEKKNFRVREVAAFLPLWFPVSVLTGAEEILVGLQ